MLPMIEGKKSNGLTEEEIAKLFANPPPIMTLHQIAAYLQIHERSILRYVENKRIPVMNKGSHALRFNLQAVLKALESCCA